MTCPKKHCWQKAGGRPQSNLIDLQPTLGWSTKWGLPGPGPMSFPSSQYHAYGLRHPFALGNPDHTVIGVKLISIWGRSPPASYFFYPPCEVGWPGEAFLAGHLQPDDCQLLFAACTPQKRQIGLEDLAHYFLITVPRIEEHPLHLSAANRSQAGQFSKHENNLPTAGTYTLKGEDKL